MPESLHETIERERNRGLPEGSKWSDVRLFRRYYRGRQRGTLNADQIRIMQSVIGNRFSHNICKKIVNEKAHRIEITRFAVDDDRVSDYLYSTWVRNQLPDVFADAMVAMFRDANTYIGLNWVADAKDPSGGRVAIVTEPGWDGKSGTFLAYDAYGQAQYAVREWTDTNRNKYRTIYYPDRIMRFLSDGDGWRPFLLPSDSIIPGVKGSVIPWVKRDGSPLGIPIIHIPNGNDDDSNYGASELDGGVLGFQDQINAIQHDITAVSLLSGSPRTTSKGFSLGENPDGTKKRPQTGPGSHWHVDEDTAEWGQIDAGDLKPLIDGLWLKVQSVCQMTNVPMHTITGQWPSGEALFRAEMPIVQDCEKATKKVGPAAASLMHRATAMANVFGGLNLDEDALIQTVFAPVDRRDPLTVAMYAEKIAPYVSTEEILRVLQYAPDKIAAIMEERRKEAAEAVERQQSLFSAGVLPAQQPVNDNPGEDDEE